jgi:hypothetical protein
MFSIQGEYNDVLQRLFRLNLNGKVSFGTGKSEQQVLDLEQLEDWTVFRDYIQEGFVTYSLRTCRSEAGLVLEVRLHGTNRDSYVTAAMKRYIRQAGATPSDTGC